MAELVVIGSHTPRAGAELAELRAQELREQVATLDVETAVEADTDPAVSAELVGSQVEELGVEVEMAERRAVWADAVRSESIVGE